MNYPYDLAISTVLCNGSRLWLLMLNDNDTKITIIVAIAASLSI